ncbi:DUF1996 domain-containing protein [Actinomadura sp. 1N219]|uniref:DUF1996 domain-containing protein n=1 Tax=Actinomadura sp. 1N219 TaxID=3375152 RepID=UPI00379CC437
MGRKKKAFAVMIPALALATSVSQAVAGTASAQPGLSLQAPGDPTAEPPADPSAEPPAEPPADPSAEPSAEPPADPSADPSAEPPGEPPADPSAEPSAPAPPPPSAVKPGPRRDQFVDIRRAPRVQVPRTSRGGSRGVFSVNCGTNEGQAHSNPDNVVAAPGVQNGAHHIHDYVGNLDTDAFSTDETLAAAGTTCTNGDKSTYFWPVLRLRNGEDGSERAEQSRLDGNVGSIVEPSSVRLQFLGNARSRVTAMPAFLRMATGDAKSSTNGLANANALWSCSGFQERGFTNKYPLCPRGSQVLRILNFAGCWDGQNTDSANHRSHVSFADKRTGQCPQGTRAIPQLRMTLSYRVPARALAFALDSFPEQGHDPVTDHGDFINVMGDRLMRQAVTAINSGRRR